MAGFKYGPLCTLSRKNVAGQFVPQRARQAAWGPLSVQELVQAAKKQRGKAAGVDQWQGNEVDSIPGDALNAFADFRACCAGSRHRHVEGSRARMLGPLIQVSSVT